VDSLLQSMLALSADERGRVVVPLVLATQCCDRSVGHSVVRVLLEGFSAIVTNTAAFRSSVPTVLGRPAVLLLNSNEPYSRSRLSIDANVVWCGNCR
jgi:hypothetical protein